VSLVRALPTIRRGERVWRPLVEPRIGAADIEFMDAVTRPDVIEDSTGEAYRSSFNGFTCTRVPHHDGEPLAGVGDPDDALHLFIAAWLP
jgi:hypothetical protein